MKKKAYYSTTTYVFGEGERTSETHCSGKIPKNAGSSKLINYSEKHPLSRTIQKHHKELRMYRGSDNIEEIITIIREKVRR